MTLDQLATFLSILAEGSLSRAARALGLSQSTVSFHLKALETAVGSTLLERRGGRVSPTAAGKVLRRYAARILALRDEAQARLDDETSGRAGELRIAASTIPGEYLLPPALARVLERHPGVRVHLAVSDSEGALAALAADECELALVGVRPRDRRFVARPFAEDEILLVGHGDLPTRGPRAAEALARGPLVVREAGSGTQKAVARLLDRLAHEGARPALVEVGSSEAAKRCVLSGLGLAFLSRHAVEDELARGLLVRVPLEGTPIRRRFHAVHRRSAELGVAARALLAALARPDRPLRPNR